MKDPDEVRKLSWFEKQAIKAMLKKASSNVNALHKLYVDEAKYRTELEKSLLQCTEIVTITHDDGDELNAVNIKTLTTLELEQTLEEAFIEMKKYV
jgi:hypothetical protein